jgi:antitoxin component YwqK of YwqJK toxin-antitoxin module
MKDLRSSLLLLACFLPLLVIGQRHKDTLYSGDTMVVRQFKNTQMQVEDYYIKGEFSAFKLWWYNKTGFGYSLIDLRNTKPKIEYRKEFYLDGQLKIEGYFIKRKKHGKYRTYYANGNNQCDCNFSDDKEDSLQTIHFDNGQIWTQRLYKNGKPWEVLSNFNKQGAALEKGTLKDGNGTLNLYDENAVLNKIEYYENGLLKKVEKKNGS